MNFYEELFKALSNDVSNNLEESCLITNEKLDDNHVTLMCGHKFNYSPLFDEIYNQKYSNNNYEIQRLAFNQIKCPYCRNIQNYLLPPPYKNSEINLVRFVNTPLKFCMKPFKCLYVIKTGKNKGNKCNKECFYNFCNKHEKIMENNEIIDNNKTKHICSHILCLGPRKGETCNKTAKHTINELHYCSSHVKKYILLNHLN